MQIHIIIHFQNYNIGLGRFFIKNIPQNLKDERALKILFLLRQDNGGGIVIKKHISSPLHSLAQNTNPNE